MIPRDAILFFMKVLTWLSEACIYYLRYLLNLNMYLTNRSLEYNLIKKELTKLPLEMRSL